MIESQPDLQVIAQAKDGEEVVQLAAEFKPDLVVLDIGLPKLNGLVAAARIIEVSPSTRLVFFSNDNAPEIVQAARNIGGSAFVCKLRAATELLKAIALAIAERREEFYSCPLCKLPAST